MSLADTPLAILSEAVNFKVLHCQKNLQSQNSSTTHKHRHKVEKTELPVTPTSKSTKSDILRGFDNSRSDSGKSSSGSPILLDCSFDSGIAGVLLDSSDMQLHKRIQQCQCILLALERDREYFFTIRNRLSKITDRKNNKSSESEFICNVCCAEIDPGDEKTYVKCYICQKYICRSIKCANWLPTTAEWECELCQTSKESLAQTSSWVAEQITFNQEKLICPPRARSEIYIPISECNDSSIHFESVSQIGANSFTITTEQKLKIRDYVEEVLAKLLGGNLDAIGVNQLSKSENYLAKDSKANNSHNGASRESGSIRGNCNDLTDISEIRLRQMIQKIIAETMNLPPLSNGHAISEIALDRRSKINDNRPLTNDGFYQRHRTEHYFEPTIYQDLLATAVLNKIVDKQLNNNQAVSETNIVDRDGDSDDINDNVRQLGSDPNFNIERSSTTSGSSVEPRSDFSYPEMEQILNTNDDKSSELLRNSDRDSVMSDYLASHMIPLPDLNAMATESDEDDYISVTSSAIGDSTWEKNWLFKKKKSTLSGSVTANSMGMLVPDPKEDVRAQIGDKTADEVSDLSELSSDTDDSLNSLRSKLDPLNDRLVSKHLIGGQNSKMVLDELIERSSIMSNTLPGNEKPSYTDACNEHVIDAPIRNEAINNNVNQKPNTIEEKGGDPKAVVSSVIVEDPSSITLSDQLSNDSNPYVCTRTNTFEEFLENGIEEKDILAINPNNNSTTNTTLTTTYPIASTEIYSKINTNATKSNSHKQPVTNMSGYTATTSSNQGTLPNDLLTSAVQKRDTSLESARRFRKQHLNNNQVKVERYTDGNYSHGVNKNIDVGVGVGDIDDGVNKDEDDDDVAIFRHFVPGSIAEREYKKWNNAVEMPNNPYAPEALKRRISGSQERFIDLPNISPTKDLNPLDLLNEQKLDADENIKRECDYKRYSRDYYINSSLTTPQLSPARDVSTLENKDNREPTKNTISSTEKRTEVDLYKAIPAQVVESVTKTLSPLSKEHEPNTTSTSDDSDTIKMYDSEKQRETNAVMEDKAVTQKGQPIPDKGDTKEEPSCLAFNRSESCGNFVTPSRGSTPIAFKFLQPKRKLLEPSQVLSVDEDDPPTASSPSEKPVIEAEVAKALPSVKALARAFLMTTNTTQPQKLWLKKARTLSQHSKKRPPSPKRSLDPGMLSERTRPEDDVTITSDLSSLETDSSSIGIEISNTSDLTTPAPSSTNDSAVAGNTSPVPVRQGVLKNNIAFFENLKNK